LPLRKYGFKNLGIDFENLFPTNVKWFRNFFLSFKTSNDEFVCRQQTASVASQEN